MFLLNNKRINIDAPVTVNGTTWPNIRDPYIRMSLGVVEVPDPVYPQPADEYYVTENEDGSLVVTRKSDEQIAQQNQAKLNAASEAYLRETDWMVIRAMEEPGKPVPNEIKAARKAARDSIVKEVVNVVA